MPPIIHPEYTEEEMIKVWPENTICQVQRDLYWLVGGIKDERVRKKARHKILLAYTMAKHMKNRLRKYRNDNTEKHKWDKGWWEKTDREKVVRGETDD